MKNWIEAFRLRTLMLSLACILMGVFLAKIFSKNVSTVTVILTLLTALFLQILSNLANDYGDSKHGADHDGRKGPKRAVQSGKITADQMLVGIKIFVVLSLITGIALLYSCMQVIGINGVITLFIIGIAAIIAAIAYTNGKRPYGYMGLGDISVFIFFGLIAVCGTYYLLVGTINVLIFLPATSCGLFSVGVLNLNNMRDIDSDIAAGKNSIPVRLGYASSKIYHYVIIILALLCSLIFVMFYKELPTLTNLSFVACFPLFLKQLFTVKNTTDKIKLDPLLKQLSISTMLFVLLFGLANLMW
ncbi:MAG: 1,4-dihydroxy-2-naphthoate polyprenyltransferase [Candidatus Methylacidiphilales bacterium]